MTVAGPGRVVVVGAGIVGCALADELTARGARDVVVVEQGSLWAAGGSTSHAPGLVFQCNSAKVMSEFARYTVDSLLALDLAGEPCFHQVGSLEVAAAADRVRELHRRANWLAAWGIEASVVAPGVAAELAPYLDPSAFAAALWCPTDGVATSVRACEALGHRATSRGARFVDRCRVTGPLLADGPGRPRIRGVVTDGGEIEADHVIMAGGLWAPWLAEIMGTSAPLLPLAHQLAWTTPVAPLAGRVAEIDTPIVRWQEEDLYLRQRRDGLAVGWYGHEPLPVDARDLPEAAAAERMPSIVGFTGTLFEEGWRRAGRLVPSLAGASVADGLDGVFSFTPDGNPLLGPVPGIEGLWAAEAVWVTHSLGAARAVVEWVVEGSPTADVHACAIGRFEVHHHAPAYVRARGIRNYVEVYDLIHPLQPMAEPRPLRQTGFHRRQEELGAFFLEASGWERPQWYQANEALLHSFDLDGVQVPGRTRDDWSARYWSPVAAAEAIATRRGVALYDMSALTRIEVRGSGAQRFLREVTTGRVDRAVGSVTYCLMLDPRGGIRSDVTVARLGPDHYQIGANGALDVAHLTAASCGLPDVTVTDITAGTVCVGLWGPLAREVVQPLTGLDLTDAGLRYFRAATTYLDMVPVTLLRVSYVGELGWEIYTTADFAARLWDTLWAAGRRHGLIAAGRAAFTSLRLEKGYRAYGTDMTNEHTPAEAGLAWAVRSGDGYLGASAVAAAAAEPPARRLVTLTLDLAGDPPVVPMGTGEPVLDASGAVIGYVTSCAFGHSVGMPVALAWVPAGSSSPGTPVGVRWFDRTLDATVAPDVLHDPGMSRLRG